MTAEIAGPGRLDPSPGPQTSPGSDAGIVPAPVALSVHWWLVDLPARTRRLAEVLWSRANPDGYATVSQRQLADVTGMALGSIRTHVARLEDAGLLVVRTAPKGPTGRRGTTTYVWCIGPWQDRWRPPDEHRWGTRATMANRAPDVRARRALLDQRAREARAGNPQVADQARAGSARGERARVPTGLRTAPPSAPPSSAELDAWYRESLNVELDELAEPTGSVDELIARSRRRLQEAARENVPL